MSDEDRTHKTTVTDVGGNVFVSLPDDQYINMDPDTAWSLGTKILTAACRAQGMEGNLVIIKPEPNA